VPRGRLGHRRRASAPALAGVKPTPTPSEPSIARALDSMCRCTGPEEPGTEWSAQFLAARENLRHARVLFLLAGFRFSLKFALRRLTHP